MVLTEKNLQGMADSGPDKEVNCAPWSEVRMEGTGLERTGGGEAERG